MRIGAVSYLNTKPLVYGLTELAPQHELVLDLPSRLADDLTAGRLDVALIPSIEFFKNPAYTIVSDACIACHGPVRSVKVFSRVPLPEIHTLALDEGSRTSVALVRILLNENFGIEPTLVPLPIEARPERIDADAVLLIGDRAMHPPTGSFVAQWDLGDVWCRWAKLPFVFAMWVARQESVRSSQEAENGLQEIGNLLSEARDLGMANVESIAAAEHAAVGLSYGDCLMYLREQLYFYLGPRELAGLDLFREQAARLGLAPPLAAIRPGPDSRQKATLLEATGSKFAPG